MKPINKTLLLLCLFLFSFTIFLVKPKHSLATGPWYNQSWEQWYVKVYDPNVPPNEIFGERYTAAQVQWVMWGLKAFIFNLNENVEKSVCVMTGGDVTGCSTLGNNPASFFPPPKTEVKGFAYVFEKNTSLSGVAYIRNSLAGFHLIPEAQAQAGFGFRVLGPVQNVWKVFRDITYGLFVLVIVAFAFMIMFRLKLNPQTVVTVQSAIPRVIITLLLITFSYAIAGFLIDIMYVAMAIISLVFVNSGLFFATWNQIFDLITTGPHSAGIIGWFLVLWEVIQITITGFLWGASGLQNLERFTASVGRILGSIILIGVIVWAIINFLRAGITFLKAYVTIIISVIFAPFIIAFGALTPSGGFGSWMKNLIQNLAVYPIGGALLLLSVMFFQASYPGVRMQLQTDLGVQINDVFDISTQGGSWYPPLTVGTQASGFDPLPFLWLISGIACIFLIPQVAEIGKGMASGQFAMGTALGAAMGSAWGYGMRGASMPYRGTRWGLRTGTGYSLNRGDESLQQRTEDRELWLKENSGLIGTPGYRQSRDEYMRWIQAQRRRARWRRNVKI